VIGYPVLPVAESPMENSHSVRRLETLLNTVCAEFGLSAVQIDGRTGVWIDADDRGPARRIATIDVAVSDGLALHRFALNCNTDLSRGDHDLPPSPSQGHRATSLTHELGREVTVADVLPALERHLPALIGAVPR
jgi:lipoyl(octanoyl) transferase